MTDDISELRTALNEAARVARSNLFFLLVVGIYLGIMIANTDDMLLLKAGMVELLLKAGMVELPLMEVGLSVVVFYCLAPALFLLLHLNLYLRLGRLTKAAKWMRNRLGKLPPTEQGRQRALVFPFDFLQLVLTPAAYRPHVLKEVRRICNRLPEQRRLQRSLAFSYYLIRLMLRNLRKDIPWLVFLYIIVGIPLVWFPLGVLLCMQMGFLAYQDWRITLWHQILVTIDLALVVLFARYVERTLIDHPRWTSSFNGFFFLALLFVPFVWSVAVVPESWLERRIGCKSASAYVFGDRWQKDKGKPARCHETSDEGNGILPFRRFLHVSRQRIAAKEPRPKQIRAQDADSGGPQKAWELVGELDLTGRSLQYGCFEESQFINTRLKDAKLYGSSLFGAHLNGANLEIAQLQRVNLGHAKLKNADLRGAKLNHTDLSGAKLSEADLKKAKLNYAILKQAKLKNAPLLGATLRDADLQGADLSGADLSGAKLKDADLRGAKLKEANLSGADLKNADLSGADLQFADLRGADLPCAILRGVNLGAAKMYGADLGDVRLSLADVRDITFEKPEEDEWNEIINNIRKGLEQRDLSPKKVKKKLKNIEKRTQKKNGLVMPRTPKADDCVWHSGKGPFESWPKPKNDCADKLANFLKKTACNDDPWTAGGIAERFSSLSTNLSANVALALLKEVQEGECPTLKPYRSKLCKALSNWSSGKSQESKAVSESDKSELCKTLGRWSGLKSRICPETGD